MLQVFTNLTLQGAIILGILALLVSIILTVLLALIYSGLLKTVKVSAGQSPIGAVTVAYKYYRGPYSQAGQYFTEMTSIAPKCRCLGIYYDNPNVVAENDLRYVVGVILNDELNTTLKTTKDLLVSNSYKFVNLPQVSFAVHADFPYRTFASLYIAIARVYPAMAQFVKDHNLCAHPFLEIYEPNIIHFMAPLSSQEEFYVPETNLAVEDTEAAKSLPSDEPSMPHTATSHDPSLMLNAPVTCQDTGAPHDAKISSTGATIGCSEIHSNDNGSSTSSFEEIPPATSGEGR